MRRLLLIGISLLVVGTITGQVPSIIAFSPTSGPVGTLMTITGTGFNTTPANNTVYLGAVKATVNTANATSLTVTVPPGTTYMPITVTTGNLTARSKLPFIVTFPGGENISNSSFTTYQDLNLQNLVVFVQAGDLDGDGKPDLVTGSITQPSLGILRNTSTTGTVSFASRIDITVTGTPGLGSMTLADMDMDGKTDIALGSGLIYRNTSSTGSISFSKIGAGIVNYPDGIAAGDIDGDGKTDLVAASSGSIGVTRNTSSGSTLSFANAINFSPAYGANTVVIGDFDGDNKPDIAVCNNSTNALSLFRNTSNPGSISFAPRLDYSASTGTIYLDSPEALALGDFDGDGKLDIAVGLVNTSTVSVFRNTSTTGNLSFASQVNYTSIISPGQLSAGDIDGDGKPDLAMANNVNPGRVSVLRNICTPGSISFSAKTEFSTGSGHIEDIAICDLDGDGKPELSAAAGDANTLKVFRNLITAPVPVITSFTPSSGHYNTSLQISGTGFTSATAVSFGGTPAASFAVDSDTSITAVVGSGANGNVSVTTAGGTATKPGFLFELPAATISGTTTICQHTVMPYILFTGSNGKRPYTFSYTINGGPSQSITTVTGDTVSVPAPTSIPGVYNYHLFNVTDSNLNSRPQFDTTIITVLAVSSSTTTQYVCPSGLPYSWNNNQYDSAGTYTAHLVNAAGCDSAATLVLFVNSNSSSATSVTVCSDALPYVWNNNNYDSAGMYTVHLVNTAGCDSAATLILNVIMAAKADSITGPSNACPYMNTIGDTAVYTIPAAHATAFNWTIAANTAYVSGSGDSIIRVKYAGNFVSGNITVSVSGNCGATVQRTIPITKTPPALPGVISGPANACIYMGSGIPVTYSIAPVANALSYSWTLPAGITLLSGQGTTTITLLFDTSYNTASIRVKAVSGCASSSNRSLTVSTSAPATPGVITGPLNACLYMSAQDSAAYTIRKVANATTYHWTVPTGATIISQPADTCIIVRFDSSFTDNTAISVYASSICGISPVRTLAVQRINPSAPGTITGPTDVCPVIDSQVVYSIRKTANTVAYNWSASGGITIIAHPSGAGVNDTSIVVVYNNTFASGTISVTAVNGCNPSATRSLNITKRLPATPGVITAGTISSCPNRQVTYSVAAMPANTTSLQWVVPVGATILSGQGTTSILVSYSASGSADTVKVAAINNCATSAYRKLKVNVPDCSPEGRISTVTINEALTDSLDTVAAETGIGVSPNPSANYFTVTNKSKLLINIHVMDISGRILELNIIVHPKQSIHIGQSYKTGTYIISYMQDKQRKVVKLLKN